jgi:rod shape-determining protein MreC
MERLFRFIFEYRAFFTFLFLEILCAWMIIENNQYQSTTYFNSSNKVAANILNFSQGVREYVSLRAINRELSAENALLRTELERKAVTLAITADNSIDSSDVARYEYISAKVVSNSTEFYKNYITIDKGRLDGIMPGMAAIGTEGAVGKVKSVSDHFAVLISLLNTSDMVSSMIKRTGHFGTAQWDGRNPRQINLRYIPRHALPVVGDTVVTSGYNAVFPQGVMVGVIKRCTLSEEAIFWDIEIELAEDFGKLSFLEIIKSNLKHEQDSIQNITIGNNR